MAVSILFPDGSIRDVPGQLVTRSASLGHETIFTQVPVSCDPMWRYCNIEGQWQAVPRHGGNVALFTPSPREWWHSIAQMHDVPTQPQTDVA